MSRLRLSEEAARDVLLVRAIETEDSAAVIFTREDRHYATSAARSAVALSANNDSRGAALFLRHRARLALDRLVGRYPKLQRARILARWPAWLNWALPLAALAIGLAANAIEGNRLNILAFPLLGMLAWNLAVYAWLLLGWVRRAAGSCRPRPRRSLDWMLSPAAHHLAGHPTLERAVGRFGSEWVAAAAPLTRSRAARTFHLGAAAFAAGIIAGMLARARYTAEYSAGWAGTWAGAEAEIAALLKVVLGPASVLTGIALPGVERLRELRGAGENAGDWLILWTVTAALVVIVPRLLLALGSLSRTMRVRRRVEVPHDFYVRRVLRDALGQARSVRVIPYSFDLSREVEETLRQLLVEALGEKTRVEVDSGVPYGAEDEWLERQGHGLSGADQLILLFNLASTPEAENHGAIVSAVRQRVGHAVELMVLLDDSGFLRKLRGQASAERRLKERLQAWKAVLAPSQIDPVSVRLDEGSRANAARDLEQALLRTEPA